jgi:hypothetical protein
MGSSSRRSGLKSSTSSRMKPPSSSAKSSSTTSSSSGSSTRPSRSSTSSRDSRGSDQGSKIEEPSKRDSHHRGGGGPSSRRTGGGSREGASRSDSGGASADPDYDYGDSSPPSQQDQALEYGYDDPEQAAAQPSARTSRRQRRCSIADVLNVPGEADDEHMASTSAAATTSANPSSLSRAKSMDRNIAIPMAAEEPMVRKGRARRASLMGAMGAMGFGGDDKKEAESKDQGKKPGQDRDRRRQGTLMDRVGAGDRERSSRGGGPSYSDRVLSK